MHGSDFVPFAVMRKARQLLKAQPGKSLTVDGLGPAQRALLHTFAKTNGLTSQSQGESNLGKRRLVLTVPGTPKGDGDQADGAVVKAKTKTAARPRSTRRKFRLVRRLGRLTAWTLFGRGGDHTRIRAHMNRSISKR